MYHSFVDDVVTVDLWRTNPSQSPDCAVLMGCTKPIICLSVLTSTMSASASRQAASETLTRKQQRILEYLRGQAVTKTYFKSRVIGDELDLSAKEVGTNMTAVADAADLDIEKWGYSSSTTWKVTTA
ncbi:hypothetical protein HLASF_0634 [Halanaeroarchaeum sulfurireducens]|uniref:DUF7123 domain-containing protein n=2 Tax=Halanaeroarchaeum sulfurireducens TaxID=1604004 RepID=A0A0F7PAA6_9EURY|nr:hypothetical protein HLASF_0634 [Halanaeroarchaeum sulfurireducens]ALG81531.1 hypothetical protein HLASA_0630 [Halanaeroarchaeum sulfurireducens]